jgi:hypothetical protein
MRLGLDRFHPTPPPPPAANRCKDLHDRPLSWIARFSSLRVQCSVYSGIGRTKEIAWPESHPSHRPQRGPDRLFIRLSPQLDTANDTQEH